MTAELFPPDDSEQNWPYMFFSDQEGVYCVKIATKKKHRQTDKHTHTHTHTHNHTQP